MKLVSGLIRLSATDLSNHLACRHVTTLDLRVLHGEKTAPDWAAPDLVVIRERGERHEAAYLAHLQQREKLKVINLKHLGTNEKEILKETIKLMEQGAEVIAQGALASGPWFGRPDVLRRVPKPSTKWNWSYEVEDTKLARETKAATILQLSAYSELLEQVQGAAPERMWVIPPSKDFTREQYRVAEYAAYYRHLKKRLTHTVESAESPETYPEPVPHCDVCRWFKECNTQRRADDHLSLVAGIRKQHRNQLEEWDTNTMAKLAALPIPLKQKAKARFTRRHHPSTRTSARSSRRKRNRNTSARAAAPRRTWHRLLPTARTIPRRHISRPRRRPFCWRHRSAIPFRNLPSNPQTEN